MRRHAGFMRRHAGVMRRHAGVMRRHAGVMRRHAGGAGRCGLTSVLSATMYSSMYLVVPQAFLFTWEDVGGRNMCQTAV
ncbi:hypothetical protein EYF80_059715 [Liparis tanakae]|uniref:Uncharacterized protein n=1 Tax=Liparis tanakae TaxID=230148 RepID=A0A4Z2EMM5_9TELE|nr:hypothetical protein EYF80_059715 [Liparis tanakae]